MQTGAFKAAMDVYFSYKFGGLLSGTYAVNAAQLCTAGINQHCGLIHPCPPGNGTFVFRYYSLDGYAAMPDGLYARFLPRISS